jgi:hypothetical protein
MRAYGSGRAGLANTFHGTRRAYRTRGIDAAWRDSYVASDRVRISRRDDSTKEGLMSTLLVVLVALVMLMSPVIPARAADDKPLSPQAQRMKDCSAQAKERALAGDARKAFMSDCLKGSNAGRSDRSSPGSASPASDTPGEAGAASEPSAPGNR